MLAVGRARDRAEFQRDPFTVCLSPKEKTLRSKQGQGSPHLAVVAGARAPRTESDLAQVPVAAAMLLVYFVF